MQTTYWLRSLFDVDQLVAEHETGRTRSAHRKPVIHIIYRPLYRIDFILAPILSRGFVSTVPNCALRSYAPESCMLIPAFNLRPLIYLEKATKVTRVSAAVYMYMLSQECVPKTDR